MTQYRTPCRCEWRWFIIEGLWMPIGIRPDCERCLGSGRVPPP